jgi:hypothetical protein
MMTNHDAFNAIVKEAVRPNWAKLAEEFANNGLTDGEGKPPTDECTRQTWWRVRKAVAARRAAAARRAGQGFVQATPQPQPKPPTQPPSEPLAETPASPRRRLELKPVTIKKQF